MEQSDYWQNFMRQRRGRRHLLRAAALATAAGTLAACGGTSKRKTGAASAGAAATSASGSAGAGATAQAQPVRGGTLNLVSLMQFGNLHPQEAGGSTGWTLVYVYDHLINWDYMHNSYDLSAAASLEQPDATSAVFKLNPAARFQQTPPVNGRQVTSRDVAASWKQYVADPKSLGTKGAIADEIVKMETPDDATLALTFKDRNAWTIGPHGIAGPIPTAIIPAELLSGTQLQKTAIGSGGYVLDQFESTSSISFNRRPDPWHADRPYIDRVVARVITDETSQAAALKSKQIDTLAARDRLQANEFQGYGKDMVIDRVLSFPRMLFMRASQGPFADERVRHAVYAGLDINGLIQRVELGDGEWAGPVPAHLPVWSLPMAELKSAFPNDLKTAKDLLTAAGWDTNTVVEHKYPNRPKSQTLAEVVQQQLGVIGIKTRLIPQDPVTVWQTDTITKVNFQLATTDAYFLGEDPDIWLRYFSSNGIGSGNPAGWSDAKYDALLPAEQTEFDQAKQKTAVLNAERYLLQNHQPVINLYSPYIFTGRWSYYHPVNDRGYVGLYGHYDWLTKT